MFMIEHQTPIAENQAHGTCKGFILSPSPFMIHFMCTQIKETSLCTAHKLLCVYIAICCARSRSHRRHRAHAHKYKYTCTYIVYIVYTQSTCVYFIYLCIAEHVDECVSCVCLGCWNLRWWYTARINMRARVPRQESRWAGSSFSLTKNISTWALAEFKRIRETERDTS